MAELWDILKTFESLDASNKLPDIFCEANDQLNILPLALDSDFEQLVDNCKSLNKLGESLQELKEQLTSTRASLAADLK